MNTQLIDKNNVEALLAFMGNEVFIPNDLVYYDNITFQGGNKYYYLNLFDYEGENAVPQHFMDTFLKFLEPIKKPNKVMDMEGLAVINLNNYQGISFSNIIDKMQPRSVTFWGVDPQKLEMDIPEFGGIKIRNIRLIRLPSPEEIQKNEALFQKSNDLIKRMFGL